MEQDGQGDFLIRSTLISYTLRWPHWAGEGENQCLSSREQDRMYLETCFPAGQSRALPHTELGLVNNTEEMKDMVSKVSSIY